MPRGGVWRAGRGRASLGVVWLLAVALFAGCKGESTDNGDDDGGKVASGTPVAATAFGKNFASAYCSGLGPCCASEGYAYAESICIQTAQAYIDAAVAERARLPGIVFNESAAGACVELYRAAAKACNDSTLLDGSDNPCRNVFQGTIPTGGHCSEDGECAEVPGSAYVSCESGVCALSPDDYYASDVHAKLGDACSLTCSVDDYGSSCSANVATISTHDACWKEDGLFCNSSGSCEAIPAVGQACPAYTCGKDAHCDASTRLCATGIATGPCPSYDECLSTSYCDSDTQMCIPRKANGATCNYREECQSGSCEGDVCRKWSIANASTCAGVLDD
jgi:hypothetical protein